MLYLVIKRFAAIDLSPACVDNVQMGYVFEELIRIGAEQSNAAAGCAMSDGGRGGCTTDS